MAKTETIRIRVEPAIKQMAEAIFSKLGLSASDAVTLFYRQVKLHRGLPFEVKIPNKTTLKAMRDLEAGRGVKTYRSVADLRRDLDA